MSLSQLSSKKQLLILLVMVLFLMGLYVKFRMISAINDVGALSKQLKVDETLLYNPNVPEEPLEDIDSLEDKVAELDAELENLTAQSANLGNSLPEINSQEVMVKISEAARASRVRIVSNVPFLVKRRASLGPKTAVTESNKKLSAAEQRLQDRAARKAMQRARRQAARSGIGSATGVGVLTQEGELMDKLVNDFDEARPMHEIKIEGTYQSVKSFIEALQGMPWQITIVKINYRLLGQSAVQGYPQPLLVEMIIGA